MGDELCGRGCPSSSRTSSSIGVCSRQINTSYASMPMSNAAAVSRRPAATSSGRTAATVFQRSGRNPAWSRPVSDSKNNPAAVARSQLQVRRAGQQIVEEVQAQHLLRLGQASNHESRLRRLSPATHGSMLVVEAPSDLSAVGHLRLPGAQRLRRQRSPDRVQRAHPPKHPPGCWRGRRRETCRRARRRAADQRAAATPTPRAGALAAGGQRPELT